MTTNSLPSVDHFARAFLSPSERGKATNELASHGAAALPILHSILSGEARNEYGVPYRHLGIPVDCALVTIRMLGQKASPLVELVRAEVQAKHPYAEAALQAISQA